jgi:hypothetical protein
VGRPSQPAKPDRITQAGRLIGLGGIVLSALVWYFTDRVSYELLGSFGTLWGFTEGAAALKGLGRK